MSRRTDSPEQTRRLFPDLADDRELAPGDFAIGRLLEDGDRVDLRWLTASVGREGLVSWLTRRGGRQLSRRSLAFWSRVLDVDLPQRDDPLWPL